MGPPPVKKPAQKKKRGNGYVMPDPIPQGEILTDVCKKQWQIGPSIGVGGFGEIYAAMEYTGSASRKSATYPYVVKIEPHGNGPLFVEMHFYMRVCKTEDIENWMKKKKLKVIGIPPFLSSGSHECNEKKYRYIVTDRYGKDLWSLFLENNRRFPATTVFNIGLQIIDILEYIHDKLYVHADIKGANLLLGLKKGQENQIFLIDFGLASRYSDKEFKPDPKKAHNGTIEYTSRDAHLGVPSRRGDMEILGYNILHWLCSFLPWEGQTDPVQVQQQKIKYMDNIPSLTKKCFKKDCPEGLVKYLNYVSKMKHDDTPNYNLCRSLFVDEIKKDGQKIGGKLVFSCEEPVKKSPKKTKLQDKDCNVESAASSPKKRMTTKRVRSAENSNTLGTQFPSDVSSDDDENFIDSSITESTPVPKKSVKMVQSWKDCATIKASNITKPGMYEKINVKKTRVKKSVK